MATCVISNDRVPEAQFFLFNYLRSGMNHRKLIAEDQTIVILDTLVARALGDDPRPDWLPVLQEMSRNGYSFSLGDTTTGELILQVRNRQISSIQHRRMITALKTFLNPVARGLPSGVDVMTILGYSTAPPIEETTHLARRMWRQLCDPFWQFSARGASLEEIRREERADWPSWLKRVADAVKLAGIDLPGSDPLTAAERLADTCQKGLDSEIHIDPPMSVRRHLEIRYRFRQVARSVKAKEPYDPKNPKRMNDGIDVDLYQYLVLPAFILSEDSILFWENCRYQKLPKRVVHKAQSFGKPMEVRTTPKSRMANESR